MPRALPRVPKYHETSHHASHEPPHISHAVAETEKNHSAEKEKGISNSSTAEECVVELKYKPPFWSPTTPIKKYFLEVQRGGVLLETIGLDTKGHYLIGRLPICDIELSNPSISRQHAIIQHRSNGALFLYDLGSTHGSFLNKVRLHPQQYCPVKQGDVLRFGSSTRLFVLECEHDPSAEPDSETSGQMRPEMQPKDRIPGKRRKSPAVLIAKKLEAMRRRGEDEDVIRKKEMDLKMKQYYSEMDEEEGDTDHYFDQATVQKSQFDVARQPATRSSQSTGKSSHRKTEAETHESLMAKKAELYERKRKIEEKLKRIKRESEVSEIEAELAKDSGASDHNDSDEDESSKLNQVMNDMKTTLRNESRAALAQELVSISMEEARLDRLLKIAESSLSRIDGKHAITLQRSKPSSSLAKPTPSTERPSSSSEKTPTPSPVAPMEEKPYPHHLTSESKTHTQGKDEEKLGKNTPRQAHAEERKLKSQERREREPKRQQQISSSQGVLGKRSRLPRLDDLPVAPTNQDSSSISNSTSAVVTQSNKKTSSLPLQAGLNHRAPGKTNRPPCSRKKRKAVVDHQYDDELGAEAYVDWVPPSSSRRERL